MAHFQQRQPRVCLKSDTCPSAGDTPATGPHGLQHGATYPDADIPTTCPVWLKHGTLSLCWGLPNHAPSWRNMGLLPRWRHPIMPTWRNMGHLLLLGTPQPRSPHGATWTSCPDGDTPSGPLVTRDTCPSAGDAPASNYLCLCWGLPNFFCIFYFHLPGVAQHCTRNGLTWRKMFFWAVLYPCVKCPPLGCRDPSHVSGVQRGLCTQRNWQGYQSTVAHSHPTLLNTFKCLIAWPLQRLSILSMTSLPPLETRLGGGVLVLRERNTSEGKTNKEKVQRQMQNMLQDLSHVKRLQIQKKRVHSKLATSWQKQDASYWQMSS